MLSSLKYDKKTPQSVYGFTAKDNVDAQAFYKALGFKLVDIDGMSAVLFHQPFQDLCERLL